VEAVKKLARDTGVDAVWLKTAQVYDFENDPNGLIPAQEKYSRYKKDHNGVMQFKGNNKKHCWRLWHDPVITWDGAVVPCCFDKDAQHRMGDLKNKASTNYGGAPGTTSSAPKCCKAGNGWTFAPIAPKG
jgi:hypothetical protein